MTVRSRRLFFWLAGVCWVLSGVIAALDELDSVVSNVEMLGLELALAVTTVASVAATLAALIPQVKAAWSAGHRSGVLESVNALRDAGIAAPEPHLRLVPGHGAS